MLLLMQCDKVKLYLLDKTTKQARDYRQMRRTNQIILMKSIIIYKFRRQLLKSSAVVKTFMGKTVSKSWSIVIFAIAFIVILSGQMQHTATPFIRV
jgi:hypothetical protein